MEIYAVEYATSMFPEKWIYQDRSESEIKVPFSWMYYVIKINGKTILMDTGFTDKEEAVNYAVTFHDVQEPLMELIGSYEQVDKLIITHLHFDHADDMVLFPNAKIIMATAAYESAMKGNDMRVKNHLKKAQVIQVDQQMSIEDKLIFKVIGGHDIGSSVIEFQHDGMTYAIAGDESYMCNNMTEVRPVGTVVDYEANLSYLQEGRDQGKIVLTFHDPLILEEYPKIHRHIVRII